MAYIRPLANGNFRADVRLKGIVKNKTFPSEKLAQVWADNIENGIKTILNLDQAQLMALSEDEICALGGEDLFKQLGIDLFAIRHQAKLEAINALSKKELLQLSAIAYVRPRLILGPAAWCHRRPPRSGLGFHRHNHGSRRICRRWTRPPSCD